MKTRNVFLFALVLVCLATVLTACFPIVEETQANESLPPVSGNTAESTSAPGESTALTSTDGSSAVTTAPTPADESTAVTTAPDDPVISPSTDPQIVIAPVTPATDRQNLSVTIALRNNPGIASLKLTISFDASLTLKEIRYNESIGGQFQQPQKKDSPIILNWFNGMADTTGDWVFATLIFDASGAAEGSAPITATYDADDVFNIKEENITFEVIGGTV